MKEAYPGKDRPPFGLNEIGVSLAEPGLIKTIV